jgi:peptidoglycan/LPS O-acetylase OafA/YrhL
MGASNAAPETPADVHQHRRLGGVDTLRCFAMTAVILQHCRLLPMGWVGVWLFYVISGFVVTASLQDLPRTIGQASGVRTFFDRRAKRIIPVYTLYVATGLIVTAIISGKWEFDIFVPLMLFYNNFAAWFGYISYGSWNTGHLWTVSVEMQFYIWFGIAFFLAPRRQLIWFLAALLVIDPVLRLLVSLPLSHLPAGQAAFIIYTASPLHFDAFAAGALLAFRRDLFLKPPSARLLLAAGGLGLVVYFTTYFVVNLWLHDQRGLDATRGILSGIAFGDWRQVWSYSVVVLASTGLVACVAADAIPSLKVVSDWPPFRWIGVRSYGAYVFHPAALQGASWFWRSMGVAAPHSMLGVLRYGVIMFAVAFPVTLGLAAVSYKYFEMPIIRSGRAAARVGAARPRPDIKI